MAAWYVHGIYKRPTVRGVFAAQMNVVNRGFGGSRRVPEGSRGFVFCLKTFCRRGCPVSKHFPRCLRGRAFFSDGLCFYVPPWCELKAGPDTSLFGVATSRTQHLGDLFHLVTSLIQTACCGARTVACSSSQALASTIRLPISFTICSRMRRRWLPARKSAGAMWRTRSAWVESW